MFYGHEVIPFTPWLPQQDEQLQQWPRAGAYEKHHWGSGRPGAEDRTPSRAYSSNWKSACFAHRRFVGSNPTGSTRKIASKGACQWRKPSARHAGHGLAPAMQRSIVAKVSAALSAVTETWWDLVAQWKSAAFTQQMA
jgi:hypothetical protein